MSEYKVGDRVRVTADSAYTKTSNPIRVGTMGRVVKVDPYGLFPLDVQYEDFPAKSLLTGYAEVEPA